MIEVNLKPDEKFLETSNDFKIKPYGKYRVTTKVTCFEGKQYSGYFGIVIFNNKNKEISRKIQWINDFSGKERKYSVIFMAPEGATNLRIIYRINDEVPLKSQFKLNLLPTQQLHIDKNPSLEENFSVPEDYILPLNKVLNSDEEDKLEENLVWIFGAPRSGTSWLGTQLLSYGTHSTNEPLIGMHLGFVLYRNVNLDRTIDLFENEADYFFSNRYKETWKYHLRKLILNRIYAQFNDYDHPIIIKEPNGSLASDIISETLPKSKFIFLKRDGRDVIDSKIDSVKKDGWAAKAYNLKTWPEDSQLKMEALKQLCKMWVNTMNIILKAFKNHSYENKLEIKYENLRENTYNELQKIYNLIEIKVPDAQLKKIVDIYSFKKIPDDKKGIGKITRSASPGKWKENFSEEEKLLIQKIMGKTLQKLGYNDVNP